MADPGSSGGRPRAGRLGRLGRGVGAAIAVGFLIVGGANVYVRAAAGPFLRHPPEDVHVELAIVPGASVRRNGDPSPQLEDRLATALGLWRAGRISRVLVSGARHGAYDEAGPMRRWLLARGIPAAAVVADHAGYRTLDTMERAARVYTVRRAVICTQAFHLPRAVFLARRAGIDAVGLASDLNRDRVGLGDYVRESFAVVMALADSYVLHRGPRDLAVSISER